MLYMSTSTELFLIRFPKGSGIEGLGGMYPITVWSEFPHMNILRPLLELRKAELQEVCQSEGVEWVEDPSNQSSAYLRNNIRKILRGDADLDSGVTQLVHACQDAREVMKHQGMMFVLSGRNAHDSSVWIKVLHFLLMKGVLRQSSP